MVHSVGGGAPTIVELPIELVDKDDCVRFIPDKPTPCLLPDDPAPSLEKDSACLLPDEPAPSLEEDCACLLPDE